VLPLEDDEEIRLPELYETEFGNEAKQLVVTARVTENSSLAATSCLGYIYIYAMHFLTFLF
jgi:hypothetical protein